ncbi:hypothetical protein JCM10212_006557 [Sporobolomyces blumeae]
MLESQRDHRRQRQTPCTFWTPSFPLVERFLLASGVRSSRLVVYPYRCLRLVWVLATLPLHVFVSIPSSYLRRRSTPPGDDDDLRLPTRFEPFDPSWTLIQRFVYPLLRRVIWAIADVGDPNDLTTSPDPLTSDSIPSWALALEWFTVSVGGGAKVAWSVETVTSVPKDAVDHGWVTSAVEDPAREVEFAPVKLYWFERTDSSDSKGSHPATTNDDKRDERMPRHRDERVVVYFIGGGFVCGSPGEGGRCFKLARETGLRVVGVNYRKATSRARAYPAALQDALTAYFHLSVTLGYTDIVLAGDSAGAALALTLVNYLSTIVVDQSDSFHEVAKDGDDRLTLPTKLLLISPWCDLSLESIPDENRTDIILPSICSNSVSAYVGDSNVTTSQLGRSWGEGPSDRDREDEGSERPSDDLVRHAWFSPSLASSLEGLRVIPRAYALDSSRKRRPFSIVVTLGTAELFYRSLVDLVSNLERFVTEDVDNDDEGRIEVKVIEGRGEVHAFPLVPEWVSPEATRAWNEVTPWIVDGMSATSRGRA